MRFLCLHGMGTSGSIFKVQTSAFRSKLPPGAHSFDFINAPHECDATRAISPFFPGPHYTFCRNYTFPEVEAAPRFVLDVLNAAAAAGNPYDALMCFSQGCAVAAGLLMAHRMAEPDAPLPVKGVVFVCGGVPLPLLEVWGLRVPRRAWEVNEMTGMDLQRKAAMAGAEIAALMEGFDRKDRRPLLRRARSLWGDTSTLYHQRELRRLEDKDAGLDPRALPPFGDDDVYGLDLTDVPEGLMIDIPTVHVYGIMDPRYPAGVQLAWMCNPEKRRVFDTGGGHEIPRNANVSNEIAGAIQWLQDMVNREGS
ncbi:serine hydrolase-domain-containing protein [Xylariaceae sp. FL0016]|nr:serine hydrolase-domain-containing protein [Xylariaceae sp. FL0016]